MRHAAFSTRSSGCVPGQAGRQAACVSDIRSGNVSTQACVISALRFSRLVCAHAGGTRKGDWRDCRSSMPTGLLSGFMLQASSSPEYLQRMIGTCTRRCCLYLPVIRKALSGGHYMVPGEDRQYGQGRRGDDGGTME